jgi:hypothetical protein
MTFIKSEQLELVNDFRIPLLENACQGLVCTSTGAYSEFDHSDLLALIEMWQPYQVLGGKRVCSAGLPVPVKRTQRANRSHPQAAGVGAHIFYSTDIKQRHAD